MRIIVVDFTRAIAILMVMGLHYAAALGVSNPLWSNGYYGVLIFFVISGFVVTRSLASISQSIFQPNVKRFYVKRSARILPLLVLAIIVGYAVHLIYPSIDILQPPSSFGFAAIATFMFNWFTLSGDYSAGLFWGVFWSISIEGQFYLVYPWVLRVWSSQVQLTWLVIGLTGLSIIFNLFAAAFLNLSASLYNSFVGFELIGIGVLLHFCEAIAISKRTSWIFCGGGAILVGYIYFFYPYNNQLNAIFYPLYIGLGVFTFLLGGLKLKALAENGLVRAIATLGTLSYGLYLWHSLLLIPAQYFRWDFATFVLATTAIAYLSDHYFEAPVNRWILRRLA